MGSQTEAVVTSGPGKAGSLRPRSVPEQAGNRPSSGSGLAFLSRAGRADRAGRASFPVAGSLVRCALTAPFAWTCFPICVTRWGDEVRLDLFNFGFPGEGFQVARVIGGLSGLWLGAPSLA